MGKIVERVLGPRVPLEDLSAHRGRYALPTIILMFAKALLMISIFLPYWHMKLEAPQYPDGLFVTAHLNSLSGDVREIDELNHYIGMRPLGEAAQLERSLSIAAIIALIFLVEGAAYIHSKWALLLTLPTILFPAFFIGDLYFWMRAFGQNLDPTAPLSGAIKPFTPPVLGVGMVGQFRTIATPGSGLILAVGASFLTVLGLWFHRRAYKPLADSMQKKENGSE